VLFNAVPEATAPFASSSTFAARGSVALDDAFFERVSYSGAFAPDIQRRWDLPWSTYDPVNYEFRRQPDSTFRTTSVRDRQGNAIPRLEILDVAVFPNPASERVVIRYNLPEAAQNVHIQLVDAMGREVVNIAQGIAQVQGIYDVPVNIEALSPGVYFVRITTNTTATTQKISVIR
jgi:Secretion system C-terminal sorting domain